METTQEQFYLISLKWTHKKDRWLTLWGKNQAGYQYFKETAGTYNKKMAKQIDNSKEEIPSVLAVPASKLEPLWDSLNHESKSVHVLRNTPENRKAIGIKLSQLLKKWPSN